MLTSRTADWASLHPLIPTPSSHGETEQPLRLSPCWGLGRMGGALVSALHFPPSVSLCLTLSHLPLFPPNKMNARQETHVCLWVCACMHGRLPLCDCRWHGGAKALTQWLVLPPTLSSLLLSAGKYKEWEKSPHYKLLKGQGQAPLWIASKSRIVESHSLRLHPLSSPYGFGFFIYTTREHQVAATE